VKRVPLPLEEPRGPLPAEGSGTARGRVGDGKDLLRAPLSAPFAVLVMEDADVFLKRGLGAAVKERQEFFSYRCWEVDAPLVPIEQLEVP